MDLQANAMYVCVGMVILQEAYFKNITLKIKVVYFLRPLPAILRHFLDQRYQMGPQQGGHFCLTMGAEASNGSPRANSLVITMLKNALRHHVGISIFIGEYYSLTGKVKKFLHLTMKTLKKYLTDSWWRDMNDFAGLCSKF